MRLPDQSRKSSAYNIFRFCLRYFEVYPRTYTVAVFVLAVSFVVMGKGAVPLCDTICEGVYLY